MPNINNLYLATGLGPSGLAIGPYGSKLVADLVMGKQVEINMEPFNIARFN